MLEPLSMETTNHPGQDLALRAAALMTVIDETQDFDSQRVQTRQNVDAAQGCHKQRVCSGHIEMEKDELENLQEHQHFISKGH